jgi:hypothetical protein
MRNAHQRFGILEFTKRMKDTTTQIRLRLDRFVGEVSTPVRNVPILISLEVSPFSVLGFCSFVSRCSCFLFCSGFGPAWVMGESGRWPRPERSPAEPEGRSA